MREEGDPELAYPGPFPAVVKPTLMGELVRNTREMRAAIEQAWKYGDMAIVDRWVRRQET